MNAHEQLISGLVIEAIADYPLPKRAQYLHALAALCSDDQAAGVLEQLAQDCEAIEQCHRQLVLNFKRRASE